jgi:cell division protein FtsZ
MISEKNLFRLDDEDHDTPQFNVTSTKKMIIEEERSKQK